MRILVVNAGSSSLKLSLLAPDDTVLWSGDDLASVDDAVAAQVDGVGHRVVHGGSSLHQAVRIDDETVRQIEALTPLAPIHQPKAVTAIRAAGSALPGVPAVACFDTSFHATLSPAAATYALPRDWLRRWDLRRFGFHGLSHQYASRRGAEIAGRPVNGLRVVSCHLGAGASVCAVRDGRSVDTSMGFTPLEGLVMGTRSGSVDPGLVLWLINEAGLAATEVADALEQRAGLAGISGGSGDFRELMDTMISGENAARLAFDVYVHRLRREIAAMAAALGGLDVLVFTGGVGEHVPIVRATAARQLGFLGVTIDGTRNNATTADGDISADGALASTVVVTAREDVEIARQARRVLAR